MVCSGGEVLLEVVLQSTTTKVSSGKKKKLHTVYIERLLVNFVCVAVISLTIKAGSEHDYGRCRDPTGNTSSASWASPRRFPTSCSTASTSSASAAGTYLTQC